MLASQWHAATCTILKSTATARRAQRCRARLQYISLIRSFPSDENAQSTRVKHVEIVCLTSLHLDGTRGIRAGRLLVLVEVRLADIWLGPPIRFFYIDPDNRDQKDMLFARTECTRKPVVRLASMTAHPVRCTNANADWLEC